MFIFLIGIKLSYRTNLVYIHVIQSQALFIQARGIKNIGIRAKTEIKFSISDVIMIKNGFS